MRRYYIVQEYFGIRVYDSKCKKEFYFSKDEESKIKNLLNKNYYYIDNSKDNKLSAPLKISMNLTKKCNLRCKQCFSDSGIIKEKELTTEEIYKLFDDMNKYGTFFICLGGGEPFTRLDLFDILEYGKKRQLAISIVSNGLLLTKEILQKLNKENLDTLWISLDGLEKEHDYLRGKGNFNRALSSLSLIKKYYKGKTAIRVSLNKYNINQYDELIRIAEHYGIDLIRFTPIINFGRAKQEKLVINQEQYIRFLADIRKIKTNVEVIYPTKPVNEKIWIGTNGFGCHCGREAIWIDELGNCSPCIFWGEKYNVGNIKSDNYIDIFNKSLAICDDICGNEICRNCKNYRNCRGGCRARSLEIYNSLDDVDPLCPLRKNKKD